ncbi:concanavalin A-like lectin/glucanase domain-containing protein [Apodospora peruviana]|uniref:Concanavalin A-like lectin/glucanase domain-containing protein n=1 Tax=Apodospora peruviana TaxID=516989 RepID=A0AAE0ICM6_9PEZI|nr:concanavalin A-like lectin/glucanase domain-containing protein [Apodospora peruviana]
MSLHFPSIFSNSGLARSSLTAGTDSPTSLRRASRWLSISEVCTDARPKESPAAGLRRELYRATLRESGSPSPRRGIDQWIQTRALLQLRPQNFSPTTYKHPDGPSSLPATRSTSIGQLLVVVQEVPYLSGLFPPGEHQFPHYSPFALFLLLKTAPESPPHSYTCPLRGVGSPPVSFESLNSFQTRPSERAKTTIMESVKQTMRLPACLSLLIIILSTAIPLALAEPTLTDDSKCGCYMTNGTETGYFTKHKFFDFRNLAQYAGVPATINNADESGTAAVTSQYFTSEWTNTWMVGNWNNSAGDRKDATVLMVNSPNNVYIEANGDRNPASQTFLTMRTQRLEKFQTAAEIESVSGSFQFLSVRMMARTIGASGAITALFTYRGTGKLATVQEADLEIRTIDPHNTIQYTNQPSYTDGGDTIDQATQNATMPEGREWTQWAVHRLDWTPTTTAWYVDGEQVANISFQTPRDPSKIILNAWSDGGEWTGNMTRGEAAYLQIQWLDVTYNSSDTGKASKREEADNLDARDNVGPSGPLVGRATEGGCKIVCSIDETPILGKPVMLWNNGAHGRWVTEGSGFVFWIPPTTIAVLFVLSLW